MPDQQLQPGQEKSLPKSDFNSQNYSGGVIDNIPYLTPPSAPNLLLNSGVPVTINGKTKINPLDVIYMENLKANPINPLERPYFTNKEVAERYSTDKWGGFDPFDINQENWYGENQGFFSQWGNRLGKFATKAVGSFAGALMDIPNVINAIDSKDINKLWDNPVNTWANDLMNWSEKAMPNYETNWEREHPFLNLVPFYGNSGNGWGKVLENVGFTVGAIGGALVEDLAIGSVTGGVGEVPLAAMQINKALYRLGKIIGVGEEAMTGLKTTLRSADDIVKGLKGIDRFNYAIRQGVWGANMITSGFSEAAFEGIESHKTLVNDLKIQFFEENGRNPNYEESQNIEKTARAAANTRFLFNAALLSMTNSIQWGSVLRPFNAVKELTEAELKSGLKVALKEGSKDVFEFVAPKSPLIKFGKALIQNPVVQTFAESSSEAFEEGAQFAIQTGVDDYYKRKYNGEAIADTNNFMKSFSTGLAKTLGTQEGWENIIFGLLGGAMYKAGEHTYYKFKGMENPNYKKEVESVIQGLNSQSLTGVFENKYGESVTAASIEKDMRNAVREDNLFKYKNYKHDHFVNFVLSGIKQNKFDARMDQLQELKKLNDDEFTKTFGIPSTTENRKSASDYVAKLEQNAKYIKDVHDRVSRTFINPYEYKGTGNYKNKQVASEQASENEKYIAFEDVKNQLVYNMSVSKDSNQRIVELKNSLNTIGGAFFNSEDAINLESEEGLKRFKTKLTQELKLRPADEKDKKTSEYMKIHQSIEMIDDILSEKDSTKQNEKYNSFVSKYYDDVQKKKKQVAKEQGIPIDEDFMSSEKISTLRNHARDIVFLQERNKAAIDNYARLTTKGGFKKLFDNILELRKSVINTPVNIDEKQDEVKDPVLQDAIDKSAAEQKTNAPKVKGDGSIDLEGQETEKNIRLKDANLSEENQKRVSKAILDTIAGKEKFDEEQLIFLGFESIDDLKYGNPNVDLTKYEKVKSTEGKNYYMLKEDVEIFRNSLKEKPVATIPPLTPTDIQPNSDKGKEPLRVEDFLNKVWIPKDLMKDFQDTLWSGKFRDNVQIRISPLSEKDQDEYNDQKLRGSYTPVKGYDGVFVSKAPVDISLETKDGKVIGKMPFPERLLFKVDNQLVTIDKLTPQKYAELTGRPAASHKADVEMFNSYKGFKNYLAQLFKNNNNKPLVFSNEQFKDLLNIELTYGEDDRVEIDTERPLYNTVKYNTVKIQAKDGSILNTMAILSVPKRYSADTATRQKTDFVNIIFNQAFYEKEGIDESKLRSWINTSIDTIHNVGSRYIGIVEQPNGSYRLVALRPAQMSDSQKQDLFTSIKDRAELSAKTNLIEVKDQSEATGKLLAGDVEILYKLPSDSAKSFNDEFNTELNNNLYITDPNGKFQYNLSVSPIGAVRLEIFEPDTKIRETAYISPIRVANMNNIGDMIADINKELQKKLNNNPAFKGAKINITSSNFRANIENDNKLNAEQLSSQLTSANTIQGFKNGTVRFTPVNGKVNKAYADERTTKKEDVVTEEPKVETTEQQVEQPSAFFGGFTVLSIDNENDMGSFNPQDLNGVSSNANTIINQEDLSDIEFNSVDDALNHAGIKYVVTPSGYLYIDLESKQEIDAFKDISPIEVVKSLGYNIVPVKKSDNGNFDFKLADTGNKELQSFINIEKAENYIKSILPSYIKVEDIETIFDKLKKQGVENPSESVFGAFKDNIIYLNKNAANIGVEYHEAFHAVFSILSEDNEKMSLLMNAQIEMASKYKKEGRSVADVIREQQSQGVWTNLTINQAAEKLAEEHLAEQFREWKVKKNKSGILQKLFDLIERLFKWFTRDRDQLEALFRNIDSGKFKYTNISSNNFITESTEEYAEPEFDLMLIPARPGTLQIAKRSVNLKRNLDAKTSKQKVQEVAAYYNLYKNQSEFKYSSDDKVLEAVLDDLKNLYSFKNPLYAGYTQEQINELTNSDLSYIYNNEESRSALKEEAKKYINSIKYIDQFKDEEQEEQEETKGQPSTGYDNTAENKGGFSNLPGLLRQYIGFTTYNKVDSFGNKELRDGIPVIGTVDAVHVYYGLMRSLANITDPVKFFQKMILFSEENEQSRFFVEKFINDSGLNVDKLMTENTLEAVKNPALVELVKKGFNKFRIDYLFTEHDVKKGSVKSYHANRKNVEQVQFDKWANTFLSTYNDYSDEYKQQVRQSLNDIRGKYFDERRIIKYDATRLNEASLEIKKTFKNVGINLSSSFIKYSLLDANAKRFDSLQEEYKKQGVVLNFDDPQNKFITKQDYNFVQIMKIADETSLNSSFLEELSKTLSAGSNPFFKGTKTQSYLDEETNKEVYEDVEIDTAMIGRLLNIAKGNALFDESVGESSYTNAENKVVYAHQDGTFNIKFSYQLRDENYRKQLKEQGYREEATAYRDTYDKEWLTDNFLLNSENFEAVANNLLVQRIDGMRAVETNKLGKVITQEFRDQKEGATYGHYSPREILVNMINLYMSYAKEQKTNKGSIVTTPHIVRILEASKTVDTVNLPINTDIYKNNSVTSKAADILYNEFQKEFNRIARVQNEISTIKDNIVENYHTGSFEEDGFTVSKGYRGLKFTDNILSLISTTSANQMELLARNGGNLSEEQTNQIKSEIVSSLNNLVDDTINVMEKEGLIRIDKGNVFNVLLHADLFKGNNSLNLSNKFKENIGHIVVNDYINTLAYNQLLHGDSALSLKNDGGIDAVKRAKGDNAAIVSMRTDLIAPELGITEPFTHSSVAIFKEPKIFSKELNKNIDVADAQMYTTVKGLRYTLWGLGRLTPRLANFLDALENGENIHTLKDDNGKSFDGVFDKNNGLLRWDEMTNSLKLVYKDGKSYFKMSVVVLQPDLTSYVNKEGERIARPGWKTLDDLRNKMEQDGIHFSAPQSASKMLTMDVSKDKNFSDLKGHLFDNTYFGLQTINPSNKMEITTPTQLLQLIDSEQDDSVTVNIDGVDKTIGDVKKAYQSYVAQKVNNAYDIAKHEIYDIEDFNADVNESIEKGKVTPRLAKFQKRAMETLEASGADAQLLDFFSLDESGNPKFNLNMSATKNKFGQLYLSYFSKGILSQKNPGYTVALFSGIDTKVIKVAKRIKNGEVIDWDVVRREQFDTNYNNIQNESILNNIDSVVKEGQYFLDELRYNVPERDDNGDIIEGKFYSEMMMPPHDKNILKIPRDQDLPESITKTFGVRIPSQDKHSFMSFKIVDFLPANLGSTAMFPKELIALSGADFDIDKEYISRYDYYTFKDNRGNIKFAKYGDATTNESKWEEYKSWMVKNNKVVKGIVNDISKKDVDYQRFIKTDSAIIDVIDDVFDTTSSEKIKARYKDSFITTAFKQLGLPSTLEEFIEVSKTKELNNGVLNNKIVDSYVALLTNKGMQDIAKTPATMTALEKIQKENDIQLKDIDGNILGSVFSKKVKYPVDSIVGKYYAFKNNTTGKDNIGIDVNANLIYSVLNKGNITLRDAEKNGFEFDGHVFSSFIGNNQYNLETKQFDGARTNDILSTLISSATDEAKEQLNALYGLTVDALKVVNYLIGLKVPLKTAIYLVNQPAIHNYLEIKSISSNTIKTDKEERIFSSQFYEEAINKTNNQIKDYEEYSDDQLFDLYEKTGSIKVEC